MVKHIIIWTLKDCYDASEKAEIAKNIKINVEGLKDKIDGIVDIKVQTEHLASSTGDVMLDSTFVSEEALKAYAVNPQHVEVANRDVRPFVASRSCLDFEI
jgi:hypothetical protein